MSLGFFHRTHTSSRTGHFAYRASVTCKQTVSSPYQPVMSRHTRDSWRATASWYRKEWTPSMSKYQTMKGSYTGWSKRETRGKITGAALKSRVPQASQKKKRGKKKRKEQEEWPKGTGVHERKRKREGSPSSRKRTSGHCFGS